MNVISLKEYAKNNNISYEAVRQQVVRYASDLEGHIIKDGRQQFLDEEAVMFLDGKRHKNPVVIYQASKDDEIERLTDENKALLVKVSTLQDQLLKAQAENHALAAKATQIAQLEADSKASREKADEAERRADVAEKERRDTEKVLEEMRREAKMRADEAQAAEEARCRAEQQAAELQAELDRKAEAERSLAQRVVSAEERAVSAEQAVEELENENAEMKSAGFFKRLFGWKK